jgi:HK97 family phage portal protein
MPKEINIQKIIEEELKQFPERTFVEDIQRDINTEATAVTTRPQVKEVQILPRDNYSYPGAAVPFAHPLSLMTSVIEECNWVDLGLNVVAAACASTTPLWRFFTNEVAKYKKDAREKQLADLKDIFEFPNPHQNGYDFAFQTFYDYEGYGNAYWQIIRDRKGDIHSIYTLPPETMRVIPYFDAGNMLHMMYVQIDVNGPRVFEEDEIIHFKRANAKSFLYGKPRYFAQLLQIATSINSKKALASWFEEGYVGGAIFKMDADADVADRNRAVLHDLYTKPENFGAVMLLEGGIELIKDGNKFKDFDFSNLSNSDRDNILFSAGVPLSMAGVRSAAGQANQEVIASEEKAFKINTINHIHKSICGTINNKLFRRILEWKDVRVEPGVLDKFSMKESIEVVNAIARFGTTPNEVRDILNLKDVPNDDAGKMWVTVTNNGLAPVDKLIGINFETGEQVESVFDTEFEAKKAELIGGATGLGNEVKDKVEKKPKAKPAKKEE